MLAAASHFRPNHRRTILQRDFNGMDRVGQQFERDLPHRKHSADNESYAENAARVGLESEDDLNALCNVAEVLALIFTQ